MVFALMLPHLCINKLARKLLVASVLRANKERQPQEACLQKGHKCWGIFDDKCDGVNLMLADGDLNITTSGLTEGGLLCFPRSNKGKLICKARVPCPTLREATRNISSSCTQTQASKGLRS